MAHIAEFLTVPNVEIAYVMRRRPPRRREGVAAVAGSNHARPQGVKDFRRMLEGQNVDAIPSQRQSLARARNHPRVRCGKHVYVESLAATIHTKRR